MSIFSINEEPLSWEPRPLGYARQGLCAQCIGRLNAEALICPDIDFATPNFVTIGIQCIDTLARRIVPDTEISHGSKWLVPIGSGKDQYAVHVYDMPNLFDFYEQELPQFKWSMYSYPVSRDGNCVGVCTPDGLWEFQTFGGDHLVSYTPRTLGEYRQLPDPTSLTTLYRS